MHDAADRTLNAVNRHPIDTPTNRPLRIFAFDPMYADARLSTVTVDVANEQLEPGPSGARVEVVDYDATRGVYYPAVDLNDPAILMQTGLSPSESDPRFHQQMVYAVAMKVIENFDRALGRRITFKQRKKLRLFPHAFFGANAFFDPKLTAVCFGYFAADREKPGRNLPGQTIFTCLSQDIIAHEVTHALVHRMRDFFLVPTNDDVLAFHEGFADIVAIFQHFTFPVVLSEAIRQARGALHSADTLIELAVQFGHATGNNGALRSALDGVDPRAYANATEPHERGSILVAAVFEAFFAIYQDRSRDLVRIATGGSGVLPNGDLLPDLVDRLSREAARAAQEVLTMCIRAFEYLPPVDITFGDYLRALVTADYDLLGPENVTGRHAMIEAFRRRGIFPEGVISLSEDALRWPVLTSEIVAPMPAEAVANRLAGGATSLQPVNARRGDSVRGESPFAWNALRNWANENAVALGLDQAAGRIAPHGFHSTYRVKPDGALVVEIVAQLSQKRDTRGQPEYGGLPVRGGATIVADSEGNIRFLLTKPIEQMAQRQRDYVATCDARNAALPWADSTYFKRRALRDFRALHQGLSG